LPNDDLSSILSMPTLVLVGDEDPVLEAARLTHQQIPGAQLVILSQAGHSVESGRSRGLLTRASSIFAPGRVGSFQSGETMTVCRNGVSTCITRELADA
jgi:hypothetical protein